MLQAMMSQMNPQSQIPSDTYTQGNTMNGFPIQNQFQPPMPSMNVPGMPFPFMNAAMPMKEKRDFHYVDVPCAALPYRFYSKIFRHIAHSYIDRLVYQKDYHDPKYLWVATEKVKGFSMSLIT